jgi:hypothetical protein
MRYTALIAILMGVVVACFAGVRYATAGADGAEDLFVLGLVLPLIFAATLVTTGTGLWVVGGRRSPVPGTASDRNPAGWTNP